MANADAAVSILLSELSLPNRRQHRGANQNDSELFGHESESILRQAVEELSWLLTRGYGDQSSLKLVGDRYQLKAAQRLAVARCACSDQAKTNRQQRMVAATAMADQELWIDGYNVLITVEASMGGGVILRARDESFRDMASMHGSYRTVAETVPAIELIGSYLARLKLGNCRWVLDRPVSNSGRLTALLREIAEQNDWPWTFELAEDADPVLIASGHVVASADSVILDSTDRWFNLARSVIESSVASAWILDLSNSREDDVRGHGNPR